MRRTREQEFDKDTEAEQASRSLVLDEQSNDSKGEEASRGWARAEVRAVESRHAAAGDEADDDGDEEASGMGSAAMALL